MDGEGAVKVLVAVVDVCVRVDGVEKTKRGRGRDAVVVVAVVVGGDWWAAWGFWEGGAWVGVVAGWWSS